VSFSDSSNSGLLNPQSNPPSQRASSPIIGDALALLSAIFYAIYVILLKVRIRSTSRIDMQLFFGFVGLFSILTCWPIGVLLHLMKFERFEIPSSRKTITTLLINVQLNF
jgi:solute carrier family 35, member F5